MNDQGPLAAGLDQTSRFTSNDTADLGRIVERAHEAGLRPRGGPRQYHAFCPLCRSRRPKLSIGIDKRGNIGLTCHGGHPTAEILDALGLRWQDLFAERRDARPAPNVDELLASYRRGELKPRRVGYLDRLRALDVDAPADAQTVAAFMELQHGLRLAIGEDRPLPFARDRNAARLNWNPDRMRRALEWLQRHRVVRCAERLDPQHGHVRGTKCYEPVRAPADLTDVGDLRDVSLHLGSTSPLGRDTSLRSTDFRSNGQMPESGCRQ